MHSVTAYIPTPPSDGDTQLLCGIRNVTLHRLDVVLLQIGRWEAIDTEDLVLIHKAAAKPSRLGPRYDEMTANVCTVTSDSGPTLASRSYKGLFTRVWCMSGKRWWLLSKGAGLGKRFLVMANP
jgi:hypothetical protein